MGQAAAFFDVDGTLVGKHIVHQYIFIRRQLLLRLVRPLWTGAFYLAKGPYYKMIDRFSRTKLNIVFYRNYAGMRCSDVHEQVGACFEELLRPHLFEEVPSCISEHRAACRRVVFVTGSIDFIIAPLAKFLGADDVLAPGLVEKNGRFTGELNGPPVGHTEKARRIKAYAETEGLDLSESFAYGDSIADLPMLQQVGHPHVVNPDRALASKARRLGWPTCRWSIRNGRNAC